MVTVTFMTPDQIQEVVELASKDPEVWALLKQRELETEEYCRANPLSDPPNLLPQPTLAQVVNDLSRRRFGHIPNLNHSSAVIAIRTKLRLQLGLSV
jgi:hypothetical protein